MSENLKVLQVFIASPNDLVDERRAIKEVADGLNTAFGTEVGLQIQLLAGRTDCRATVALKRKSTGRRAATLLMGQDGSLGRTSLR
jgi:hypothetical protein